MPSLVKVLLLFSGIGAYEKALSNLKIPYELVAFSEKDKFAVESYCAVHNIDKDLNLGDITKLTKEDIDKIPYFDLLVYSPPCQAFSVAGERLGFKDKRGVLFFYALEVIKAKQPKLCIMENVKGLTFKNMKYEFNTILESLEETGYNNYWKVLNAKDYGIPQNRERLFIVSIRKDIDTKSFEFIDKNYFYFKNKEKTINDILEATVSAKYNLSEKATKRISERLGSKKGKIYNWYNDVIIKEEFKTLTTNCGSWGARTGQIVINSKNNYRRLTPIECWRLMGFDDKDVKKCREKGISDTQLYKMAGNSICVPVIESIYLAIQKQGIFF